MPIRRRGSESASRTCSTRRSSSRRSSPRSSPSGCRCARSRRDPRLDLQAMTEEYLTYGHRLERYIADTSRLVLERLDAGELVVFEGAQGALLDIDHGTYPFVTSSNPSREPRASARASARRTSTRCGASPRRTRPASARGRSRPSLRARRPTTSASAAASTARPPAGRGGLAGSTSSRCAMRLGSTR